jgi:hypothetical protein
MMKVALQLTWNPRPYDRRFCYMIMMRLWDNHIKIESFKLIFSQFFISLYSGFASTASVQTLFNCSTGKLPDADSAEA